MNNCSFIGRLTHTPELKNTPSGTSVCNFTLAVERRFSGSDGEKVTDYIDCVAWKHNAEFLCKWFDKGVRVGVTGELQTRMYEDKTSEKKTKVCEVLVSSIEFADGKREANTNTNTTTADDTLLDTDEFITLDNTDELPFG